MKLRTLASALIAVSLATSGLAFAQGHGDQNDRNRNEQYDHNNRPDHPGNYRHDERGAGPNHEYYRGGRMPKEYRSSHYVVDDWRGHHLSAPPRGYHWVQTGGDFVLVAIATGIIAELFLNH